MTDKPTQTTEDIKIMLFNLWWAIKEIFCDQQKDVERYRKNIEDKLP